MMSAAKQPSMPDYLRMQVHTDKTCDQVVQMAHPLKGPPPVVQRPHLADQPTCIARSPAAWHGALQHVDVQQAGQDARQVPDQRRMGGQDLSEQQLHPAQVLRSTEYLSVARHPDGLCWHGARMLAEAEL